MSPTTLFAAIVAVSILFSVGYVAVQAMRSGQPAPITPPGPTSTATDSGPSASPSQLSDLPRQIVFQNVDRDSGYARVATVSAANPGEQRSVTGLTCERVHFAGGRGLCLVPEHGLVTSYYAVVFDASYQPIHRVPLSGAPTRTRVSADGRYGVATVFVFGHSYADANFSTQTIIIDMTTGQSLGDLESYTTSRDDAPWVAEDFNFWGVTFMPDDSNEFYATLRSAGATYLVRGDVAARTMTVLQTNVECPSLSPDGTRIAYKKLIGDVLGQWRLHVLDLATMTETALAETRNIDDQAEWLDNDTVLYGDGASIWSVPSDGRGEPTLFISDALSPAIVR
jgi:hypothetical protein